MNGFCILDDMCHDYPTNYPAMPHKLIFSIGDVLNKSTLKMAGSSVNFIFHAASLKQFLPCEFLPMEAVKTNVVGTDNVLDVAKLESRRNCPS